jgi:hypothetical protein
MIAYHGNPKVKSNILKQLRAHAKADEIVKGQYWEDGKGCAVGCTVHGSLHAEYEPRFGIPQMLARLEDTIFEGLPNAEAKKWPIEFMSAIKPGADLSCVGWQFLHWLLTDEKVNPGINHPLVRDAVRQCADVLVPLTKGLPANEDAAKAAARAAESAWSAARSAFEYAAADAADAAWSARAAAGSAAWLAGDAAAKLAANAATSAGESAESAAYSLMASKLLELLHEAGA